MGRCILKLRVDCEDFGMGEGWVWEETVFLKVREDALDVMYS